MKHSKRALPAAQSAHLCRESLTGEGGGRPARTPFQRSSPRVDRSAQTPRGTPPQRSTHPGGGLFSKLLELVGVPVVIRRVHFAEHVKPSYPTSSRTGGSENASPRTRHHSTVEIVHQRVRIEHADTTDGGEREHVQSPIEAQSLPLSNSTRTGVQRTLSGERAARARDFRITSPTLPNERASGAPAELSPEPSCPTGDRSVALGRFSKWHESGTKHRNDGQSGSQQSNQAPSKGCLTRGYAWSGRRDSNPHPHLGNVRMTVQGVHDLRFRAPPSTFRPPNTPQSTQFVERSTFARLLSSGRTSWNATSRSSCSATLVARCSRRNPHLRAAGAADPTTPGADKGRRHAFQPHRLRTVTQACWTRERPRHQPSTGTSLKPPMCSSWAAGPLAEISNSSPAKDQPQLVTTCYS